MTTRDFAGKTLKALSVMLSNCHSDDVDLPRPFSFSIPSKSCEVSSRDVHKSCRRPRQPHLGFDEASGPGARGPCAQRTADGLSATLDANQAPQPEGSLGPAQLDWKNGVVGPLARWGSEPTVRSNFHAAPMVPKAKTLARVAQEMNPR